MLAALAAGVIASAALTWTLAPRARGQAGGAAADALAGALARERDPAALLETFLAAGTIRSAVVYDRGGAVTAHAGVATAGAEQVCRSLSDGGSFCIEPASAANGAAQRLIPLIAVIMTGALLAGALFSALARRSIRRRLRAVRAGVEEAMRDPAYATRVAVAAGELGPLTATINQLLEQAQARDVALRRRALEIEGANRDLEGFASAISHDLRAPLGSILGFAQAVERDYAPSFDAVGKEYVFWIHESARQMSEMIEGLLQMSRLARVEMIRDEVDLSAIARGIATSLQRAAPERDTTFVIPDGVTANGDERLMRAVLENLLGNAWKFTGKQSGARIELGVQRDGGQDVFFIRDNGAGFDPAHAAKMFRPFQRLHSEREFSGTGIGLATVQKIVQRHGGRVWAEGEVGRGATIYFTTGVPQGAES